MKTTLFIPVLNEIESSQHIMPQVNRDWVDEILVVDGNSTDGTGAYFEKEGYKVIYQKSKKLGGAYWEALEEATGDVIIPFSPDGNSIPETIPRLVDKMKEGYDVVIASRYREGAKSEDDDPVTAFGNWMFTRMANLLHGCNYTDLLVMFRAFKKDLFYDLDLTRTEHPYFEQELLIRAHKHKLNITEIPADEPKRIGGTRKVSVLYNGSIILYAIWKELFVHRVKKP